MWICRAGNIWRCGCVRAGSESIMASRRAGRQRCGCARSESRNGIPAGREAPQAFYRGISPEKGDGIEKTQIKEI